jgi:hypothetical protein
VYRNARKTKDFVIEPGPVWEGTQHMFLIKFPVVGHRHSRKIVMRRYRKFLRRIGKDRDALNKATWWGALPN